MKNLAAYRKALVAAVGVIAQIANANLVSGTAGHYLSVIAAVLTLVFVHQVPNATTP